MSIASKSTARDTLIDGASGPQVESSVLAPGLKVHVPPPAQAARRRPAPALDSQEWLRRAWHIAPGFLPFLLWVIPHQDPFSWEVTVPVMWIIVTLAYVVLRRYRTIKRSGADDPGKLGTVLGYALSVSLMVLCFPAYGELAFLVLAIIAFGDGLATLVGLSVKGPRLPWNSAKTWAGFISFIIASTVMGSTLYWGEANPHVPFQQALQIAVFTGVLAAICESLPSKINDNIRVGVSASFAAIAAQAMFVGF